MLISRIWLSDTTAGNHIALRSTKRSIKLIETAFGVKHLRTYKKFSTFTTIPSSVIRYHSFDRRKIAKCPGDVVECGVWRGGLVSVLGHDRVYFLFDSFEGLSSATKLTEQRQPVA
jgi:hypothetical protein